MIVTSADTNADLTVLDIDIFFAMTVFFSLLRFGFSGCFAPSSGHSSKDSEAHNFSLGGI